MATASGNHAVSPRRYSPGYNPLKAEARIAWTARSGARNVGAVTFHRLDENRTKIMLQVDYEPEGVVENVGDTVGVVSGRIKADLERFKEFIESRHRETGARPIEEGR